MAWANVRGRTTPSVLRMTGSRPKNMLAMPAVSIMPTSAANADSWFGL
ncbi:hypothetical protein [Pelistega indica]|nr:hypothetical protein [Pelistega indica]